MNKASTMSCRIVVSMLCMATLSSANAAAEGWRSAGNGTVYSFHKLAATEGSGVMAAELAEDSPATYYVTKSDTIDAADSFVLDDGAEVRFRSGAQLVIMGKADLSTTNITTLTPDEDGDEPYNLRIDNESGATVKNVHFVGLGLDLCCEAALNVSDCSFSEHNGTSAAALYIITGGRLCTISNTVFENCQKAAIGSSANASRPLTISHCRLSKNSTRNGNIPQINITAAPIEITDCTILGDSTSREANNKVGGIGISNFFGFTETSTLISGCTICHNRYGIGTTGPIDVRIEDNVLLNNNHEANAMQGGSGISLYDPYMQTCAVVAGNRIEGNLWGITIIGCKDVNLGQPANKDIDSPGGNIFNNNGCLGELYDLYNNSALTVYAQGNTWGVDEQTPEKIETVIFHQADDASLGQVIYLTDEQQTGIALLPKETGKQLKTDYGQPTFTLQGTKLSAGQRQGIIIRNGKKYAR